MFNFGSVHPGKTNKQLLHLICSPPFNEIRKIIFQTFMTLGGFPPLVFGGVPSTEKHGASGAQTIQLASFWGNLDLFCRGVLAVISTYSRSHIGKDQHQTWPNSNLLELR